MSSTSENLDSLGHLNNDIEESINAVNRIPYVKTDNFSSDKLKNEVVPILEEAKNRISHIKIISENITGIRNEIINPVNNIIKKTARSNIYFSIFSLIVGIVGLSFAISSYFSDRAKTSDSSVKSEKLNQTIKSDFDKWPNYTHIIFDSSHSTGYNKYVDLWKNYKIVDNSDGYCIVGENEYRLGKISFEDVLKSNRYEIILNMKLSTINNKIELYDNYTNSLTISLSKKYISIYPLYYRKKEWRKLTINVDNDYVRTYINDKYIESIPINYHYKSDKYYSKKDNYKYMSFRIIGLTQNDFIKDIYWKDLTH